MPTVELHRLVRLPRPLLIAALALFPLAAYGGDQAATPAAPAGEAERTAAVDERSSRLTQALELLGESPVAALLAELPAEARRFNDHVITLANPFFEGRAPGTAGNRFAAEYIEHYFRKFGLQPAFDAAGASGDGQAVEPRASYRQTFRSGQEMRVVEEAAALLMGPDAADRRDLGPGRDFVVLGASGSGHVQAPVVFAGYGIVDGPEGYASFPSDADFAGKIAMVLRFEPMDEEGHSLWADRGWSPAAQLEAKIAAVVQRKAAGVILVNPPGASDPRATTLMDRRAATGGGSFGRGSQPPVVQISHRAAEQLFMAAFPDGDMTLLRARQSADDGGAAFELPDVEVELRTRILREPVLTDNVGAILPGRGGLAREFIVIGAHYDHVGYGPAGAQPQNYGKLHPGADDNASGTAGVLILAEKLSEAYEAMGPGESARSIMFLAFSAEELGLIGSRYFVNNPPSDFELGQISLMLNLDMIGRLRETGERAPGLSVEGVESARGLLDWLRPYFEQSDVKVRHAGRVSPNSDHASFHRQNIPVLFFFTGLHREYHMPTDVGATINQLGAAKVLALAYDVALGLALREQKFQFAGRRSARPQAGEAEEPRDPPQAPATPRTGGVRFGIAPGNYNDDEPGIEVAEVYENTSAAEAGVKIGDRIIRWNEHEVTTVESWMPLLARHKPGDVVKVTVVRGGEEITLDVTLRGRDGGN
jgi:hypothetical protein